MYLPSAGIFHVDDPDWTGFILLQKITTLQHQPGPGKTRPPATKNIRTDSRVHNSDNLGFIGYFNRALILKPSADNTDSKKRRYDNC
jgi:hypothetical protein